MAGTSLRRAPLLAFSIAALALCWLVLAGPARAGGPTPPPDLASLSFAPNPIAPGGSTTGTITLSGPAPPGGTTISLAVSPSNAATVPPTLTIPAGASSVTFDVIDARTVSSWVVTAVLGAEAAADAVYIQTPLDHLVINEVDYDQPGATDSDEFVELYNGTASTVDVRHLALAFSGGSANHEYLRVPLGALHCLPSDAYAVVADDGVSVASSAGVIRFPAASNNITNAGHSGVALIDPTLTQLIDSLWYEGSLGETTSLTGFPAGITLNEGNPTTAADSNVTVGSLAREPNGTDTDNAQSDWTFEATPSPGSGNAGLGGEGPGLCPNNPPALDAIGAKTVEAGHPLTFTVSGSDPDAADAPLLTYSASNLPPGASFDPGTRQFSWTPGTDQVGSHPGVHFALSDGMAGDAEDVAITVTEPQSTTPPVTAPPGPPAPPVIAPAVKVPNTRLARATISKRKRSATFKFSSDQKGVTYLCSLDRKKFARCRSPKTYKHLKRGRHTFRVKAKNGAGADATPAVKKFKL